MFKKLFLSIILVFVFLIVTTLYAPVTTNASSETEVLLPMNLQGIINTTVKMVNNETGETVYLNPKLLSFHRYANGLTEISYEVGIPSRIFQDSTIESKLNDYLFPSIVTAASRNINSCDSSSSGCANLTFYYSDFTTYMYANYARVVWTKIDSQITFVSGVIGVRCMAAWKNKVGYCSQSSNRTINSPSSGTAYTWTPSFAGSTNQVYYDDSQGEYAVQFLNMRRGGTNWQFYTCVAVGGGNLGWC